jgi:hypothetical protein
LVIYPNVNLYSEYIVKSKTAEKYSGTEERVAQMRQLSLWFNIFPKKSFAEKIKQHHPNFHPDP